MEIAKYHGYARKDTIMYIIMVIGFIFFTSPFFVTPSNDCIEYPCPIWLRLFIGILGFIFFIGALLAIVRNLEYGSYIDGNTKELVWWHGVSPAKKNKLLLDTIKSIKIDDTGDNSTIEFFDKNGSIIYIPNDCFKFPYNYIANNIKEINESIIIVIK